MPRPASLTVPIRPEHRKLIDRLCKSGRFRSERHAVDTAMWILDYEDRDYWEAVEGIRRGLADADAGRTVSAEEVFMRLDRRIKEIREQRRASPKAKRASRSGNRESRSSRR